MSDIKLPVDATGRKIPLDTKSVYYKDGCEYLVSGFEYVISTGKWKVWFDKGEFSDPANLYLDKPDSWGRLLADLDRAASGCSMCNYVGKNIGECSECKFNKVPCTIGVFVDIADRIRALRGDAE